MTLQEGTLETRTPYYYVDSDGYLISTVFLTAAERALRTDLVDEMPTKTRTPANGGGMITLEQAKVFRWQQIKAKRKELEYGPFTWDGSQFDGDAESQQKITGAVSMANMYANYMVDWTLADNTVRTLTSSDMKAVGVALATSISAIYAHARDKRTEIDAATTVQAVLDITW